MPLATTSALEILKALLQAEDPGWRSGATRYLAAHTANPGVGGSQTTSECAYTGYLRVAITAAALARPSSARTRTARACLGA